MRRLTIGLALLRALGVAAVLVLLANPARSRLVPASGPPLVLLDASLSMASSHSSSVMPSASNELGCPSITWLSPEM